MGSATVCARGLVSMTNLPGGMTTITGQPGVHSRNSAPGVAAFAVSSEEMSTDGALEYAQFMLANMARTEDVAEGFAAFNARRPPNWTGR